MKRLVLWSRVEEGETPANNIGGRVWRWGKRLGGGGGREDDSGG